MKLKKLNIQSYRHLEGLSFDFTYPDGHEKAGEPLDKICFIGQSATGKTGILELVRENFSSLKLTEVINGNFLINHSILNFKGSIEYLYQNDKLIISEKKIFKNGRELSYLGEGGGIVDKLIDDGLKLLYFSSEIVSNKSVGIFNQNPLNILNNLADEKYTGLNKKFNSKNYVYEFLQEGNEEIWFSLLYEILEYRKKFTQMASELISKGAIGDVTKLNKEYSRWSSINENPLISFADFLNPILSRLNLEVDLINTEFPIPIKSKINGEIVPISHLSTGTKGLLLSMFPLFQFDTTDAIVLIDEPERSLFPDVQIDLITQYQKIAPSSQLIVATHSPFIAAAFEPEERFILYFDKLGKVAVRKGESPIGDDPNDILRNDFNIDYYNEFGKKAYKEYLDLKRKVLQESRADIKKELIVELATIGDKYNF